MFWKKPSIKELLPPPVHASHGEYSMILSMHDENAKASPSLIHLSLQAIKRASQCDLSDISARLTRAPYYPEIWPGEHYKLLSGLTEALQPTTVIEIGTATGLSALCIKKYLSPNSRLYSFDIIPWHQYPNTHLTSKDFEDRILTHCVADLGDFSKAQEFSSIIQQAQLIFIDATHDGKLEKTLLDHILQIARQKLYILFDDIRVWTMLKMWRNIRHPKLDLTSFGHWSGTGLVEINSLPKP